eukprot:987164-Pelagomonas_calceolata.AAC.1
MAPEIFDIHSGSQITNSIMECAMGLLGGGIAGCVAVESGRRRIQASRSMADNLPGPQDICLWLSPRLAVSNIGLKALR